MTDFDQFERRLAAALRTDADQSVDSYEAGPIARAAIAGTRPARRIGRGRGITLLAAAALLLVGGALAAGSGFVRLPSVVPPVPAPSVVVIATASPDATSPIPTPQQLPLGSSLCPGGTRASDIRTLSQPVSTEGRWVADPPPTGARPIAPREIAVVGRATTGESSRGVYLVDLATGSNCLLVELPPGRTVTGIVWAPSGDALAVGLTGLEPGGVDDTLTWSALGTTASFDGTPEMWSPDGSSVLVGFGDGSEVPSGLQLVPADGSTPLQFACEPGRANPCPAFPRVHWAPDGSHISLHGGDRWAPALFSIAALADRQMLRLDTGLEAPDIEGWLDPDTLLVSSRSDLFRVPISDPRAWVAYAPGTYARSDSRHHQVSPDLAFAALEPAEFGDDLDVLALATGRSMTAVRPADVGDDLAISQFQWAPTSDAFAFALTSKRGVVPGLWVVDRDGTGLRQVSTFQIEPSEGGPPFAWRPAWP